MPALHFPHRRAALHATAAAACFAIMAAAAKGASKLGVPDTLIVFARNAVAFVLLGTLLLRQGPAALRTQRLGGHLWRSAFGLLGMYTLFYAISHLSLAEALLLNYSSPLFIPLFAWWVLDEKPPAIMLPATLMGLVGVACIVKPGAAHTGWPAIIGALSGVFAACAMVSLRRISNTEPATRIVFYFALLGVCVSALPLLKGVAMPSPLALGLLLLTGLAATGGQLQLTHAYSYAPAARVGAMGYSGVLFAGLLGWGIWGETPDAWSLLGAVLVIGTCVLAAGLGPSKKAIAPLPSATSL